MTRKAPRIRRSVMKAYNRLLAADPERGDYWLCRRHRSRDKAHDWSGPFPYPWDAWAAARRHAERVPGPHDLRVLEVWP